MVILFLSQLNGATMPKGIEIAPPVIKMDYVKWIQTLLNTEGQQNPLSRSKVTAILLKGWIFLLVQLHGWRVCDQQGYPVNFFKTYPWVLMILPYSISAKFLLILLKLFKEQ